MNLETLIQDVLKIDAKSSKGPWKFDEGNSEIESRHSSSFRFHICEIKCGARENNLMDGPQINPVNGMDDAELITHYRTSSPKLAKALLIAYETLQQIQRAVYVNHFDAKGNLIETDYADDMAEKALAEIEEVIK